MAKFTLLEIHLDGASVDATADAVAALPFSSVTTEANDETADEEADDDSEPQTDEESETVVALGPLTLLALVVLIVLALKKLRGSDEETA